MVRIVFDKEPKERFIELDGFFYLQGIEEMIKSPSKFVFIFLPGVKEHLKQYCENDDAYRLIQRAIKVRKAVDLQQFCLLIYRCCW